MKKTIYLLRHGQTELNTKNICQGGRNDSPLTELGIAQTKVAKEFIKNKGYEFGAIYSSALKRAITTATLITEKKPIVKEGLNEIDYGDLTGCFYELSHAYKTGFKEVNGESFFDAEERFENCLKEIAATDKDNILVVCHGFVIKLFYCKLTNSDYDIKVLPNLGIMVVEYDGSNFKFVEKINTQI